MTGFHTKVHGLWASRNRRFCEHHQWHGIIVVLNNIMRFKTTIVYWIGLGKDGKIMPEEAIKAVLFHDVVELCTVGFLLKSNFSIESNMARYVGQVSKILRYTMRLQTSPNHKNKEDHENCLLQNPWQSLRPGVVPEGLIYSFFWICCWLNRNQVVFICLVTGSISSIEWTDTSSINENVFLLSLSRAKVTQTASINCWTLCHPPMPFCDTHDESILESHQKN